MRGFLGTGATLEADVNLVAQVCMGTALVGGAFLARKRRYTAHGLCQSLVLLLNLVAIILIMWPSFHQRVMPLRQSDLRESYYGTAIAHATLSSVAELFGLYVVIVAGTRLLPPRLRFSNWKRWMRIELGLWWMVILSGLALYYVWYIAPTP